MSLPTFNRQQSEGREIDFTFFTWDTKEKIVTSSGSPGIIPPGVSKDNIEPHYAIILDKVESSLENGQLYQSFEFCLDRDTQYWVKVQSCPVDISGSSATSVMVNITDITGQIKQKEDSRTKYNEILSLCKMIIHDVKNPLMTILNVGRLLNLESDTGNTDGCKSYTELINQVTKKSLKMADKTAELLTYISDKSTEDHAPVNLAEELYVFVAEAKGKYPDRRIELNIADDTLTKEVVTDRSYIRAILDELLSNSLKYSEPQDPVTFKLNLESNKIVLVCMDKGIGIPSLQASTLLQKLPTTSRPGLKDEKGHGLGLPIIKKLVDNLNGTMHLASEEDEGTTVTIRIPVK
ncbi:MAG: HAMP domain-containing sensor histidine kinase [Cyclobacteriaceae bacterium]